MSILLPVRNEGINIRIMLKLLDASVDVPHEVLVIYDDPRDETAPVIEEMKRHFSWLRGIQNTLGRGVPNAIKAGIAASRGEYILIFAADEVGPVMAIEDMMTLLDEGCDFVSCTRYAHGGRRLGGSFIGGVLSRTANILFGRLSGTGFTDATTGIKMFRRSAVADMQLLADSVGWAVTFEMAIRAHLMGLKLGEVPIISIDRLYGGESTFRLGSWVKEYWKWFVYGVRELRANANRPEVRVRVPRATAK